jgi:simple sugar transport system permease protein
VNISIDTRKATDWLKPILIIGCGFAIGGVLIFISGKNPFVAYRLAFNIFFSGIFKVTDVFVYATVLMIIGAGLVVAFTGNIWNVGAEGQLWVGALVATFVVFSLRDAPSAVLIPILFISAFVGGALWAFFPGILKAKYGTNEVLTTMLMCPIAYYIVVYFLWGALKDPVTGYAQGELIPEAAFLPVIIPGTRFNMGLFVSLAATLVVHVLIEKTVAGYKIKMIGASPKTARFVGIRLASMQIWTMVISGGICGLAGAQLLMGVTHRLLEGLSPGTGFSGYGFMGIAVVIMAKTKALVVIATALLFAFLITVTFLLEASAGVSHFIFVFIQGIIIMLVVWLYK